jgi:two-component system, OmpR family, KDP operon response regulator KdpE
MYQQSILLVDDEAPMRRLLSTNLKACGFAVHAAADGFEAMRLIEERQFDLLLLDVNMPGPSGLQLLEAVRREADIPILMISADRRESDILRAFNLGVDDYLCKPFGVAELLARVKALLRRTTSVPRGLLRQEIYRYKGLEVDFDARRAKVDGAEVPLTKREFEVLAYLAQNAGKIVLHRQILQAVWGPQYGDESDYIWTFVQRIRRKIEPDHRTPRFLFTEPGVGYRMPSPDVHEASSRSNVVATLSNAA